MDSVIQDRKPASLKSSMTLVASGNLFGQILSFVSTLVVVRALPIQEFGRFGVALGIVTLVSQIGDLGINLAFVKLTALLDATNFRFYKRAALQMKLLISLGAICLGVALCKPMAWMIFRNSQGYALIIFSCFTASIWMLFNFAQCLHQAKGQFKRMTAAFVGTSGLRVALVAIGAKLHEKPEILILLVGVSYLVGTLGSWVKSSPGVPFPTKGNISEAKRQILTLGKWTGLSVGFAVATDNIHIFMVQRLSTPSQSGLFAAAWQLSSVFSLFAGAVATVMLPKMATLKDHVELRAWRNRSYALFLPVLCLLVLGLTVSRYAIPLVLGVKYSSSYSAFAVLLSAFALCLPFNHLWYIFLGIDRPWVLPVSNLLQFLGVVSLDLALVPKLGGLGASLSVLTVRVVAVCIMLLVFGFILRGGGESAAPRGANA